MPDWAVAMTKSRQEDYAAENLKKQGFEYYLPKYVAAAGERPKVLFPNYIFVLVIDRWRSLRNTYGIMDLCMDGDEPAKMHEAEMKRLKSREIQEGVLVLDPFKPGQKVRSKRGWAKDQLAVFVGMSGRDRCQVLMEMLGMQCKVGVQLRDLEAA